MRGSSATSAPATTASANGPFSPSASGSESRPSPIADGGYPLCGVSDLPDPAFHAYRHDLADVALAGRVIASHYAEPLLRHVAKAVPLLSAADDAAEVVADLSAGDDLWLLDDTRGWAWGYAGADRRVGYVRSEALRP